MEQEPSIFWQECSALMVLMMKMFGTDVEDPGGVEDEKSINLLEITAGAVGPRCPLCVTSAMMWL